jgi:protein subunit release factor A
MAKKGKKVEEVLENVQTPLPEVIAEVIAEDKLNFEEILPETINDDDINELSETFIEETSKKEEFLNGFEEMCASKSESEIKEELLKEIERVDATINNIKNKIPMTTCYWNGVNFDF